MIVTFFVIVHSLCINRLNCHSFEKISKGALVDYMQSLWYLLLVSVWILLDKQMQCQINLCSKIGWIYRGSFFIIASSWRVYNSDIIIKALTKVFLIFSSIFCSEITNLKRIQPKDLEWMTSKVITGTVKFIKYEYKVL